jgi:hypothetical protein
MTEQERLQHIETSRKVAELLQEYKDLVFRVRSSRLPLAPGNTIEQRLYDIRVECWEKYNFDIKKSV